MSEQIVCNRCVMDTTAKDIIFDSDGVCNFCNNFFKKSKGIYFNDNSVKEFELNKLVSKIHKEGKRKKYDCIIGVSGGVDSSWVLVKAVSLGLRPLAVHMDNGWNSELAQNNILNLIKKLQIDLYTYVIDWSEYRKLMQSFFDADVVDVELLYDNAMLKVNYMLAKKYNIKYILSGMNKSTEGIDMPIGWNWFKYDKKQIKSISYLYGKNKLQTFPSIGTFEFIYYRYLKQIKWISFLDYLNYVKEDSLKELSNNFNYKKYPYKHYESIFTRFYQGYLLPRKSNIDKRKVHFSSLITTNQINRKDALNILTQSPYVSENELENDIQYFLKKMNWNQSDLDEYLNRPTKDHNVYKSEFNLWKKIFHNESRSSIYYLLKKIYTFLNKKLRNE